MDLLGGKTWKKAPKLAAILDFGRKYRSQVITNMFNGFLVYQNMGVYTKNDFLCAIVFIS